jgi:hypothetical protein
LNATQIQGRTDGRFDRTRQWWTQIYPTCANYGQFMDVIADPASGWVHCRQARSPFAPSAPKSLSLIFSICARPWKTRRRRATFYRPTVARWPPMDSPLVGPDRLPESQGDKRTVAIDHCRRTCVLRNRVRWSHGSGRQTRITARRRRCPVLCWRDELWRRQSVARDQLGYFRDESNPTTPPIVPPAVPNSTLPKARR